MILEFFLTIILISFILIILGVHVDGMVGIVGGTFLFIAGITSALSPLTLHTTDNVTVSYTYLNSTTGVINSSTQLYTPNYTTLDNVLPSGLLVNRTIGIFLALIGVGIVAVFAVASRRKGNES
jgi:hypothetical protein